MLFAYLYAYAIILVYYAQRREIQMRSLLTEQLQSITTSAVVKFTQKPADGIKKFSKK